MASSDCSVRGERRDAGFTLVEILITIVILGLLATVTVFAVRGITDRGEIASCDTDEQTLLRAADIYLGERQIDLIPASGSVVDGDTYEATLVEAGMIKDVSSLFELAADGTVTPQADICVRPAT